MIRKIFLVCLYSLLFSSVFSVTAQPNDQDSFEDKIIWSEARPLTWDDFKGETQDIAHSVAETNAGFKASWHFINNYKKLEFKVYAYFIPSKSWFEKEHGTDYVLNHEQRHFDIAEIFARKLRRRFTAIRSGDISTLNNKKLSAIYKEVFAEYDRFQQLYDEETESGVNEEVQEKWNQRIDTLLENLVAFAQ